MVKKLNTYKFSTLPIGVAVVIGLTFTMVVLPSNAVGQSKIVSIVKGASNPSSTEPYNPSPLSVLTLNRYIASTTDNERKANISTPFHVLHLATRLARSITSSLVNILSKISDNTGLLIGTIPTLPAIISQIDISS